MATSLPNDVISEILSWLPVKSACWLRSVSKGWHALVSNPSFLAAHKAHNEPHLLLVASPYLGGSKGRRELQLVDLDGNIVRVVEAVGNPWRICSGPDGPVCATRHGSVLNLIDLATGMLMTSTEMGSQERYIDAMGFGYATPSGAPKVVRLTNVCEVVTVEDGARWRRVESHPADLSYYENSVVTIDGVMYFLYSLENEERVLCFDL
ncbi:F-box/kelch-repeat protein At2g43270-like [Aegilops tauschii subsp. strangulata]|uniref:F-box/kelch-repeat protein At2g43270-like n=1 Tax=Aegilops tauschii subsp. strangulata TaxID=200361 RepID=UPI00098AE0E2|nr:putative F-box protein At1g53370 [Aegilops tauschii subsp. strangulata]